MAHRTTFSLDSETIEAVRRLAELWRTSQAGVIRRAVRVAAEQAEIKLTPQQAIASLRAGAVPMDADQLRMLATQVRTTRIDADDSRP